MASSNSDDKLYNLKQAYNWKKKQNIVVISDLKFTTRNDLKLKYQEEV